MNSKLITVREFEEITGLDKEETADLKEFALPNRQDKEGKFRPVLDWSGGRFKARNYVGIIRTRKGKVLEILPKVDLSSDEDPGYEETRKTFLEMLRTWRGLNVAQFSDSSIRALQKFNMLEIFMHLFLQNLARLTQRGLAKRYQLVEENLHCLKGRILFPLDIRTNIANRARFYVQYDDFNANRPANRLIHSTIDKLRPMVRRPENQQLLHQMKIYFIDVPVSHNHGDDWKNHKIDRNMQHYRAVMQWVRLFLLDHGLTTFSGKHVNQCLLFPMEQIFEDFVAHCFRKHQDNFRVQTQGPVKHLVTWKNKGVFQMRPDITLGGNGITFVLDTKWKRINATKGDGKHDISQSDMYQLHAYGKKYQCRTVALIYPRTKQFIKPLFYRFDDNLQLLCLPFDETEPQTSVTEIINHLKQSADLSHNVAA